MATLSNQNTVATNQTTFSFITPIKLDRSKYMVWKNQVLASIRGNRLEGYINGEKIAPNQFIALNRSRILNAQFGDLKIKHYSAGFLAQ